MAQRSQEELYIGMQRGFRATADLSVALPLLEARRKAIVDDAIARFNSRERPLSDRDAILAIAALAENQHLIDDLKAAESDGRRDQRKLEALQS